MKFRGDARVAQREPARWPIGSSLGGDEYMPLTHACLQSPRSATILRDVLFGSAAVPKSSPNILIEATCLDVLGDGSEVPVNPRLG